MKADDDVILKSLDDPGVLSEAADAVTESIKLYVKFLEALSGSEELIREGVLQYIGKRSEHLKHNEPGYINEIEVCDYILTTFQDLYLKKRANLMQEALKKMSEKSKADKA